MALSHHTHGEQAKAPWLHFTDLTLYAAAGGRFGRVEQLAAHEAHNLEDAGSSPAPANAVKTAVSKREARLNSLRRHLPVSGVTLGETGILKRRSS
jgi:hypothetical protein